MNSIMVKVLRSALPLLALLLVACGGGAGGAGQSPAALISIAITPSSATLAKGQIASFTATAKYSDASTANVTSLVTWASSNPLVAGVNPTTGVATAIMLGNSTISASLNGISSPTVSLNVTAAIITAVNVMPIAVTTPKGVPTTFTATATYSDGTTGDVSATATWFSSAPAIVTLNTSGIASSLAIGGSNISAKIAGVSSNVAVLTVAAPALTAITINPVVATVAKGLSSSLTATGTYSDASTADITTQVTWATANPVVAVIAPTTGVATGAAVGTTTINATALGIVSPNATLTVTSAVLTGLNVMASATTVPKGVPVTFTAVGTYSDATTGNVSGVVTWLSSNVAVAPVGVSGLSSTPALGTSTVTASFSGLTSNAVTLTVTAPVLASLAITPASVNVVINTTQQFTATGVLTDGTPATLGLLNWVSSGGSYASISTTGLATATKLGSTNITASSGAISSNIVVLAVVVAPGTKMGGSIQGAPLALTTAVTTFAGLAGAPVTALVDGVGTQARFMSPGKITTDGTSLYVVDSLPGGYAIRKIVIATGTVSTLIAAPLNRPTFIDALGLPQPIWWADGSSATAVFGSIDAISTDGANLYVVDGINCMIRKVIVATGQVITIAGGIVVPVPLGQKGVCGGLDGIGTAAGLGVPSTLSNDGVNLYFGNRKMTLATGAVTTLAGWPVGATGAVTTDGANLFAANSTQIYKMEIATGIVTALAGSPIGTWGLLDGIGVNATFSGITDLSSDGTYLYTTEAISGGGGVVRKVTIATGQVTTIAGGPVLGALDALGRAASFSLLNGITTDGVSLYVSDTGGQTIRKIQ